MRAHKLLCSGIFVFAFSLLVGLVAAQNAPLPPEQATTQPASPPQQAPVLDPQDPRYRLNVEVELVNLTATVHDEGGKYLDNLSVDDFQLFEDGQEQKISFFSHDLRVPISVGILVDVSGSMRHKLQQALQTVREIALALSPQDEMFLVTFNSDVELRHRFTSNSQDVLRALRDLRSGGETAAYDAINLSVKEMQQAKHNKKILLLVTDGFDTRSQMGSTEVEELLKRTSVLVYAIGIDDDDDDPLLLRRTRYHIYHYMLNKLAGVSGGRTFRLFTGRNYALQSLAQLLLEELHQQYTLSYYPSSGREGTDWRNVEIKVRRNGSQIRHRPGYYINSDIAQQQ
jgi:Ca-activated chloride channel family protein